MTTKELAAYLHYSNDEIDQAALQAAIDAGKANIKNLIGTDVIDFNEEGPAKDLLKNWCRYYLNNAIEYFTANFKQEISTLQFKVASEDQGDD